jgi:hypothetical protein
MSKCRDCSVAIKFVRIAPKGRMMPIDPVPDEDGNVVARLVGGSLAGHVLTKGEEVPEGWQRYMPHAATCAVRNRGRRGVPSPRQAPTLFDDVPQTPDAPAPGQQEGTT